MKYGNTNNVLQAILEKNDKILSKYRKRELKEI
jgi:hypothetical protein